ncbi:FAD/NAD(P)-binding domain-containing protein [Viridothelium virens]|uniref:FAD/NAD(P)-binding domain-containing protein n=1 Tax=Viridothelium virens TaxID=1048519 RepID=A0A6A6H9H8_VIRVR|nr:FAD/NAD(P)-binding domain-containing protein [Viridothelium virens]
MPQPSITIIGAGISGLTAGRVLLKRGIRATIYDKHPPPPSHRNAYGITLYRWAYQHLLPLLEVDEFTFHDKLSTDISRPIHSKTTATQEQASVRAQRARLEYLLREDLDIRWNHKLENIKPTPTGISLIFATPDTTHTTTDILIAADGVHSTVRTALLPNSIPHILPFAVINGKHQVPSSTFGSVFRPAFENAGSSIIETRPSGASNIHLQIALNEIHDDGTASLSWTYSRPAYTDKTDPLHRADRSPDAAREIPEAFFEELGQLRLSGNVEPAFADVFATEKARQDRLLHWLMRSVRVPPASELRRWGEQGILMVGDAVHAQPILGGEAANAGIVDGVEVGEWVGESREELADFYNEERLKRWENGVEGSEKKLDEMHGMWRSTL